MMNEALLSATVAAATSVLVVVVQALAARRGSIASASKTEFEGRAVDSAEYRQWAAMFQAQADSARKDLDEASDRMQAMIADYERRLTERDTRIRELEQENRKRDTRIRELEEQVHQLQREVEELKRSSMP